MIFFIKSLRIILGNDLLKLIKFSLVGLLGSIINLLIYTLISLVIGLDIILSSCVAFIFAVTSNYFFNQNWTFKSHVGSGKLSAKTFLIYFIVNLKGLAINLLVLNYFVSKFGVDYHLYGQLMGIGVGMLSNFIYSNEVVFKRASLNKDS